MKKDMAGAAIVLGLAQAIMDARLPVRLRVLLPCVENAVSGMSLRRPDRGIRFAHDSPLEQAGFEL